MSRATHRPELLAEVEPGHPPTRSELLAEVEDHRERSAVWKRRASWAESAGGVVVALLAAVAFRIVWSGRIFARPLGATSWLLTALVAVGALVVTRGVVATIAARWLAPARRELVTAESRLSADDRAVGREH